MKLPRLYLVTISGAHGTGKSTLADDLRRTLSAREGRTCAVAPSCATLLFERMRDGHVEVPGGVIPQNYDDLNRLGLRWFFQQRLPDVLATAVELTAHRLAQDSPHPERAFLVCDRWFPDIYAYTHVESKDTALRADVIERCRSRCDDVLDYLQGAAETITMLNVFVPLGSSNFPIDPAQAGKFRATCNRDLWENACLGHWKRAAGTRQALFMLTKTGRRERVNLLLDTLGEAQIDRLTKPAGERSPRSTE